MRYKIKLDDTEKLIVKVTKLHFKEINAKYRGESWHNVMLGVFPAFYVRDMDSRRFEDNYLIFRKLYEILMKISESPESHTMMIFKESYNPISWREGEPIQRAISEVCALIQGTTIKGRFSLRVSAKGKKGFLKYIKQI